MLLTVLLGSSALPFWWFSSSAEGDRDLNSTRSYNSLICLKFFALLSSCTANNFYWRQNERKCFGLLTWEVWFFQSRCSIFSTRMSSGCAHYLCSVLKLQKATIKLTTRIFCSILKLDIFSRLSMSPSLLVLFSRESIPRYTVSPAFLSEAVTQR